MMKSALQVIAIIVFALAMVHQGSAQAVSKDKERAENERDLELRSWNLRILWLRYNQNKTRSRPQGPLMKAGQFCSFVTLRVI